MKASGRCIASNRSIALCMKGGKSLFNGGLFFFLLHVSYTCFGSSFFFGAMLNEVRNNTHSVKRGQHATAGE